MTKPTAARLFVLLARTAPVGVILRRGPTDWVQLIHWDTQKDIFTPGQWFHGRIYEYKCDLAPNGKLMVYYAYKYGNHLSNPDYGDYWTAICKPPFFTALALWPDKNDSKGGGYFYTNNKMVLAQFPEPHPDYQPKGAIEILSGDEYIYLGDSVYQHRLMRDGWQSQRPIRGQKRFLGFYNGDLPWTLEDQLFQTIYKAGRNLTLVCKVYLQRSRLYHEGVYRGRSLAGIHIYKYSVLVDDTETPLDSTWADIDRRNRLVLAKEGKLFSATLENGELVLIELADFNAHKPEAIESPVWAKKW